MKKILLLLVLFFSICSGTFSQSDCATAAAFCSGTGTTFPASTTTVAPAGPDYGCLGSQPNPAWYYLNVSTSGNIVLDLSNSAGVDIDFAAWGPFATQAAMCAGTSNSPFDCSYSSAATEQVNITAAVAGEWYMVLITNFSGMATDITVATGPGSTGSTNCAILCNMTALTAVTGACNPATNTYTLTGNITYTAPPSTGTLTVTNSCSGVTQVFNPPFSPTSTSYSLAGLPANGAGCTVTATFSADPTCTFTTAFTAPPPCTVTLCNISSVTASPSACDPATNNYSVSGNISFTAPPGTGTLTVSSSCGGSVQVLNPPFVSPLAYALNGLPSNGAGCTVTAVFSADAACTQTQSYTAPAACATCPVTAGNNGPLCEGQAINLTATNVPGATYSWTGPGGFISAAQNPVIPISTGAMAGVYTVTVNVAGPPSCVSSSSTTVVINPLPLVVVNSPTTCAGINTTLTATGATSFLWSTGGTTSTITVPGTSATYTVTGTSGGCTGSAVSTVTTSAPPTVSFSGDTLSGCNPVTCNFVANTAGNPGATYQWDFGDGGLGTGPMATHTFINSGCQTVALTVSFGSGCSSTDSIVCMVNVFPQPKPGFTFTPATIDILNPTAFFTNTTTNGTTWFWDFGDSTSSTAQNPSHTWEHLGAHTVTLYASNSHGCNDSIKMNIIVEDIITAYIPNTFSPNGDGMNDEFNIYSHGIAVEKFELLIFDRWGNKIFTSRDVNQGWKGSVNNTGEICKEDVYVYRINYQDFKGKKHKAIGHITIVK